jgi:hypothetical protein
MQKHPEFPDLFNTLRIPGYLFKSLLKPVATAGSDRCPVQFGQIENWRKRPVGCERVLTQQQDDETE